MILVPVFFIFLSAISLGQVYGVDTVDSLIKGGSCSTGQGGVTTCRLSGAVLLSGLSSPLTNALLIIGVSDAATVLLSPNAPLVLGSDASLSLANLTIANATFIAPPSDPLTLGGLQLLGQAALSVTGCILTTAGCSAWNGLISATCQGGLVPADATVRSSSTGNANRDDIIGVTRALSP